MNSPRSDFPLDPRDPPPVTSLKTPFHATLLQDNKTLESITINGKLDLASFRDGKTQSLDLSQKEYRSEEAIIIGALLKVPCCLFVPPGDLA